MSLSHHAPGSRRAPRRGHRRDGGYVLAKFALLLVPLLLMTGLSVDVGYWYNRASEIQKAADAAALAGVVWLPDLTAATTYAKQAAAKNGFVDDVDGIDVTIERAGDRRLRVSITDDSVGSFLFLSLGGREIQIEREGLAEYVLPVPMGSPRNYFGTGRLPSGTTGTEQELLYQSVNPTCTSKIQGDRHQTFHFTTVSVSPNCGTAATNVDYRSRGYELYVEAKQGRTSNIDVLLYDPRYNNADITYQVPNGQTCVNNTYNPVAPDWTDPSGTSNVTITGPAQYVTRTTTNGTYGTTLTLLWPNTVTFAADRIKYRLATITWNPSTTTMTSWTQVTNGVTLTGPAQYVKRNTNGTWPTTSTNIQQGTTTTVTGVVRYRVGTWQVADTCTTNYDTITDSGFDNPLTTGTGTTEDERFTFSLYEADNTPLTDEDNPLVSGCSKTYEPSTAFDTLTYLTSVRWSKLCTITTTMPTGRYILRVHNEGSTHRNSVDGSNQWGLVAKYTTATGNGLCDGRTDTMCPRVYGRDAISVYANTSAGVASFFLAEIEAEHNGKTLELELWDPGEGGSNIQFQKPTGSNTWSSVTFTWISYNDDGTVSLTGSGTQVDLRDTNNNDRFNGKLLRIQIPLTNYNPPTDNRWWKIQYTFVSGSVTDRTTWSARVIGDPVHLLEEEAD